MPHTDEIYQSKIGVSILVLGFSNFIWVPIGRAYGRRPMAFLANLLNVASMIWRAQAKSYGSFMGACVVTGIACGPSETLPGMVSLSEMTPHTLSRMRVVDKMTPS